MFKTILFTMVASIAFSTAFALEDAPSHDPYEDDSDGSLILSLTGVVTEEIEELNSGNEDNKVGFGFGALIEAGVNDYLGLETGALFMNQQYDYDNGTFRVVQHVKRLHVPVLLRVWPTDFLSIGAGPFAAIKIGDRETTAFTGPTPIGSFKTSADDDVEYGFDFAGTLNFAVADKTGIFVEARYSAFIDPEEDEDINTLAGLAGVKVDI